LKRGGGGRKLSSPCSSAVSAGRGGRRGRALQKVPWRQREPPLCRNLPIPARAEPLMTSAHNRLPNNMPEETLPHREPAPGCGGGALRTRDSVVKLGGTLCSVARASGTLPATQIPASGTGDAPCLEVGFLLRSTGLTSAESTLGQHF